MYHHLNVYLCEEPGIKSPVPWDKFNWNCFGENEESSLPTGVICESQEFPMYATFDNKSIGLKLPEGYAYRAGGDTGYKYIVLGTHYPKLSGLKNGRTGHSELVLRMRHADPKKRSKRAGLFNLSAWGLIPPLKVASMNGSYVYDQPIPMTPIALLTHTHAKAVDFEFWVETPAGERTVAWREDPSIMTYFLVPPNPLAAINMGDKLTVRCTYDNANSNSIIIVE